MCAELFCDDFKQANPCKTGEWIGHNFGPSADKPVPGHEDSLATRACVICSLVIHIDDDAPDGVCPWVEHRAA